MIIQTVTESDFRDAFYAMHRGDNFSYHGIRALYNYLENECGETTTLDVIAICCEYTEQSLDDSIAAYDLVDRTDYDDDTDYYAAAIAALHDHTMVVSDTDNATGTTLLVYADF